MTNVLSGLSCETLYKMYQAYLNQLKGLVQNTRSLLRNMTDIVSFPFKRIQALVDEYISALNNLKLLDFSNVKDLLASVKRLLDCPVLADAFGKQISDIIDNAGKGLAALKKMVSDMLSSVADKVKNALAPLQKMLQTPLDKLTSAFDTMASTKLGPIFKKLGQLEECLGNMCAAYKAVKEFSPGSIIKPLEKFGVSYENGKISVSKDGLMNGLSKKVTDIKEKSAKSYSELQKGMNDRINEALAKADAIKKGVVKWPALKEVAASGG
mgnify:CR=1 FL=1